MIMKSGSLSEPGILANIVLRAKIGHMYDVPKYGMAMYFSPILEGLRPFYNNSCTEMSEYDIPSFHVSSKVILFAGVWEQI